MASSKRKSFLKFLLFIAIAVLVFFYWTLIVKQVDISRSFYEVYKGDKAYKNGQLQEAIDYYNKALVLYPEHAKARYNLGSIYSVYEDFYSAVFCYEKALEYDPNLLQARIDAGVVLSEYLFDFDRAIYHYEKAITSKPFMVDLKPVYSNLLNIRINKAIAYYNMGLAYRGKSLLEGDNNLASRHHLQNSAQSYKRAIKIDPQNYDNHYNLGLTFQLLGDFTEATEEYCKAIYLKPLNFESHYNLAILLRKQKNYTAAIEEFEKAGIILDSAGDGYKTRYIYDFLNDATQKAIGQKEKYPHLFKDTEKKEKEENIYFADGKVVFDEELDNVMLEEFKSNSVCKVIE